MHCLRYRLRARPLCRSTAPGAARIASALRTSGARLLLGEYAFVADDRADRRFSLHSDDLQRDDRPAAWSFEALLDANPVTNCVPATTTSPEFSTRAAPPAVPGRMLSSQLDHHCRVVCLPRLRPGHRLSARSPMSPSRRYVDFADELGGTHAFVPRFDPSICLGNCHDPSRQHAVPTMVHTRDHPDISNYDITRCMYSPWRLAHSGAVQAKAKAVLPGSQLLHVWDDRAAPLVRAMDVPP